MDRTLTCRDCGQTFTFTAGEQSFYAERGYTEPQRCPACRAARKAERNEGGGYSSGGGGGYGGGGGGRGERTMHPAVCSNCGKETEVPFVPTMDKPVYCRECFQERRATSSYDRYR
ncbi:zinc-ribbon domain containing protein [soil metagenome]